MAAGMASRPVRQYLWLLVGVLLAIMLVMSAVSLISLHAEDVGVNQLATVVGPAYDVNAQILQTMTNAETGLQGYLADQDPVLLAPYDGAEQQVHLAQGQLRALLASPSISASDQSRYAQLQTAQDGAIAVWWRYAADAKDTGSATGSASLIAGKTIFDQVRAANAALASMLTAQLDALRAGSRQTLRTIVWVLLVTTVLAMLVGLVVAGRVSRAVTVPVIRLREVVQRHREGHTDLRADTASGSSEVRDLAVAFDVLSAQNAKLAAAQADMLRLQQVAFEIGRAIRATSGIQEAMDVVSAQLGPALAARRVGVTTFDETRKISIGGQWHAPGLGDITRVTKDLESHMALIANELWSSGGRLLIDDLLATDVRRQAWAQHVHCETGATALILVPIGLGDRAIGNLYVATDTGPRHWTDAEAAMAQQIATFLARAITEAEHAARRREYVDRLEDLDRQKTEFLSTVSHELRTPLTSIQGYLELLLEGEVGPVDDSQRHMLGVIERNTVRLRGLIEDILVLNKIETGGLVAGYAEVSVRGLVDDTIEELRPVADKSGVRLHGYTCPEDQDPATVIGDRAQLQRALVNIVSNAIKFTPSQGTVRLSCQIDPETEEVVVTCEDTGIGIPEADLAHLFTRFFRASNASSQAIPGTGLGLAIVRAIVEIHRGRLTLDSVEGKGTTITLRLPLARPAPSPSSSSRVDDALRRACPDDRTLVRDRPAPGRRAGSRPPGPARRSKNHLPGQTLPVAASRVITRCGFAADAMAHRHAARSA
jgi:two-component system phosphate regulon sensor histidine kinase PhoR